MKKDSIKMSLNYYGKRYELLLDKADIIDYFEKFNQVRKLHGNKPLTIRDYLKWNLLTKIANELD